MSNIKLAFQLGVAFGMGRAWAKSRNMAMDADKWITVKPNGEENKGRPVLIDGESGTIKGGMGGKFTGKNIRQDWKQNNKTEQKVSKPEQAEKPINAKALLNEERGLEQVFAAYKEDESLSREELTNLFMSDSVKGKEGLKDFLQTFYPDKYKRLARHIERWDPQKAEVWWYENVNEFEPESTYDNEAANKKLMEHYANNVPDDRFQEMSDRSQRENFSGSYHSNAWQHTKTNRYFGKNATFGKKEQNNGTNQQEGGAMKVSDDNWESAPLDSVEDMLAYAAGVDGWANGAGPKGERLEQALFAQGYKSFHGEIDGKPVKVGYRNGQWRFKGLDPDIDAEPDPYQDRVMEVLKQLHENGSLKKGLPKKAKTDSEAKPSLTKTSNGMFATTRTYRALGIEGKGTHADPYTYKGKKVPFDLNKAKYNWDQDSGRFVFKGQTMNSGYAGRQAVNFLNDLIDEYNGQTETDGPKVGSGTKLRSMQEGHSYNPDKPLVKHFSFGRLGREVFSPNGDGVRKNYQHYESLVERAKNHFTFSNDPKHLQRDMNTYAKARNDVEEMDKKLEANPKAFKQLSQDEQNKYLRSMAICQFFEGSPEYSQVLQDYSDHRYKNGYTQPETAPWPEEMRKPRAKKTTETAKTETSAHPWMNNFGLEDHPDVQKALNRHKESSSAASRSRRKAGSEPADMDDDGRTMRQYLRNPQKSYDDLMKTVQWPESFPENKRKRLAELEAQTNFLQALVSGNDYERGHPVLKRYYDLLNEQRELNNELQEHFQRS